MLHDALLPIVGFFIGVFIVSLGGGGGMFYVGILTVLFNVPPAIAASTSLATAIPSTAVGTISHWRAGNINVRYGLTMLAGGVVGTAAGSLCSGMLPRSLYDKLTGVILVLLSAQMVVSFLRRRGKNAAEQEKRKRQMFDSIKAALFGLLAGVLSGLVGLSGGGPVIAGLTTLGCGALETVGTSVLVIFGIATAGFGIHLGFGSVDWKLVLLLATGTVCGAAVGPILLKRVDKKKLEKILQPLMLLMTVGMGIPLLFK